MPATRAISRRAAAASGVFGARATRRLWLLLALMPALAPLTAMAATAFSIEHRDTKLTVFRLDKGEERAMAPLGLYIADGQILSPVNRGKVGGNFFLKPNNGRLRLVQDAPAAEREHARDDGAMSMRQSSRGRVSSWRWMRLSSLDLPSWRPLMEVPYGRVPVVKRRSGTSLEFLSGVRSTYSRIRTVSILRVGKDDAVAAKMLCPIEGPVRSPKQGLLVRFVLSLRNSCR